MGITKRLSITCALALASAFASGCSDDDKKDDEGCSPDDVSSCDDGFVCEQLGESEHACLAPVLVSGRVYGSADESAVAGATVVGLDANGAARTRVARTDADGRFELPVSVKRDADGKPIDDAITLRVGAADFQPFPTAPRTALPIKLDLAESEKVDREADESRENTRWRIENAATDVSLLLLPEALRGGATVTGRVGLDGAGGVLVLALDGDRAQSSAISDLDGEFVLFNVSAGSHVIEGYRQGLAIEPLTVDVPAAGLEDVLLNGSESKLSTVSGNLSIVNADGGLDTTVILVVASTFDANLARGESPAGLRAIDIGGAFEITDVPPGRYAVLAAFENDQLVRDPDEGIAGTDVTFVDVTAAGGTAVVDQSFKVTEALGIMNPGDDGIDVVPQGMITLTWVDDSSEDGYELRVYDALGTLVHEDTEVARNTGSETVGYMLDASAYERGMLYQFRVWSWRERTDGRTYISASEDLKGVFEIAR
jgi:hypothetical protein